MMTEEQGPESDRTGEYFWRLSVVLLLVSGVSQLPRIIPVGVPKDIIELAAVPVSEEALKLAGSMLTGVGVIGWRNDWTSTGMLVTAATIGGLFGVHEAYTSYLGEYFLASALRIAFHASTTVTGISIFAIQQDLKGLTGALLVAAVLHGVFNAFSDIRAQALYTILIAGASLFLIYRDAPKR